MFEAEIDCGQQSASFLSSDITLLLAHVLKLIPISLSDNRSGEDILMFGCFSQGYRGMDNAEIGIMKRKA
jgi:hypothetical protein